MRTGKEIFEEMCVGEQSATKWINDIEEALKEAYNEALYNCLDEQFALDTDYATYKVVEVEDIEKLKK